MVLFESSKQCHCHCNVKTIADWVWINHKLAELCLKIKFYKNYHNLAYRIVCYSDCGCQERDVCYIIVAGSMRLCYYHNPGDLLRKNDDLFCILLFLCTSQVKSHHNYPIHKCLHKQHVVYCYYAIICTCIITHMDQEQYGCSYYNLIFIIILSTNIFLYKLDCWEVLDVCWKRGCWYSRALNLDALADFVCWHTWVRFIVFSPQPPFSTGEKHKSAPTLPSVSGSQSTKWWISNLAQFAQVEYNTIHSNISVVKGPKAQIKN